jgi:oxygen-independent coproporphyrinogen-3 oxidase
VGSHFSLYQLTIEKGTPFFSSYQRGEFTLLDEDVAVEMYEYTESALQKKGLMAYEVSNYAKRGFECQHNLTYWRYGEYIGIGPGAHGRIGSPRMATMMINSPEGWLKSVEEKGRGLQSDMLLTPQDIKDEAIMMGLRLVDGIDAKRFHQVTGLDIWQLLNAKKLEALSGEGLLEYNTDYVRATAKGRMLLSSLTGALLA